MYKEFTYGSGFAGIGGMTMGLEQLGGKGVIAWEFDPTEKRTQYAQECHKLLHPSIPVEGDITKVNTDDVTYMDVFCFTPPCQTFSVAGKRGGFEDTRGTLTFDALRIAKDKKPKVLFMENVKGLINHDKGNSMSTIIHAINDIGYVVDFTVLNSKYFDVAQNRERVYLIAIRNDLVKPEKWKDINGNNMLPKAKKRYLEEGAITFNFEWPEQKEVRTKLKDFLENEVDEKYYLPEEKTKNLIIDLEKNKKEDKKCVQYNRKNGVGKDIDIAGFISSSDWRGLNRNQNQNAVLEFEGLAVKEATKKGYSVAKDGDSVNIQFPNSQTRRGRVGKQLANTLEASGINQGVVEISPVTVGRIDLKGHDAIKRVYSVDGQGPTLTTMGGGHREPKIAEFKNNYKIRKITPRECLRLQSVPEKYIDLILENFSDSRAYKFAGNGLTINVVKAIGEKILKYL